MEANSLNIIQLGRPQSEGELIYIEQVFSSIESNQFFESLLNTINWSDRRIQLFGRQVPVPRKVAWYADPKIEYRYSGGNDPHNDWTNELLTIKNRVEQLTSTRYNGALLNLYRDGNDSMGWHSDNEPELGVMPELASISFVTTRTLKLRHRDKSLRDRSISVPMHSGSLLLMRGALQKYWQHQVPKTSKPVAARINITFRNIKTSNRL